MSEVSWFEIPVGSEARRGSMQVASAQIRVWVPGDGLSCSASLKQKLTPCTVPVAVIEVTGVDNGYRPRTITRTFVACRRHVAQSVRDIGGHRNFNLNAEADRIARETVLARHWDEYQAAIVSARESLAQGAFESLPDVLRDALSAEEQS